MRIDILNKIDFGIWAAELW